MLNIILLLLKIIGIVLAVVLGLVILVILLVLFAPIRYKADLEYYEKPKVNITVTWLLFIRAKILYESELAYYVKIFFFNVVNSKKDNKEKPDKKSGRKQKKAFEEPLEELKEDIKEETREEKEELKEDIREETRKAEEEIKDEYFDNLTEDSREEIKKRSFIDRIRMFFFNLKVKIKSLISIIKGLINKSKEASETVKSKIEAVKDTYQNPANKELVKLIISQLKKLLRIICPKKYKISARLGFEDPAKLGNVLMYISVFYGLTGMNLELEPVFGEDVKEGRIFMRGRIRLISILIIAIKVYSNKQFRKLISK